MRNIVHHHSERNDRFLSIAKCHTWQTFSLPDRSNIILNGLYFQEKRELRNSKFDTFKRKHRFKENNAREQLNEQLKHNIYWRLFARYRYYLYSKIGYNNLFSESVITLTILRSSRQAGRQTGRQTNGRTDKFTQNEHGIRSRFKILTFDSPEFACVWNVWFVEQLRNNVWVFMYIEFIEFISNVKAS